MTSEIDPGHFRKLLIREQRELEEATASREAAGATVELDQQKVGRLSRMDAMQMQAMAQAEQRRALMRHAQIVAALKRIDSGDYGLCAECDEPIARGRLEANPSTPLCIGCAELVDS